MPCGYGFSMNLGLWCKKRGFNKYLTTLKDDLSQVLDHGTKFGIFVVHANLFVVGELNMQVI